MADYIVAPITVDSDELKAAAFDYLRSKFPDWEPADGNLDAWIIEAFAEVTGELHETAADVTAAIFRYYGANVAGIPPIDSVQATGTATFVLIDNAGYTIPEGLTVAFDAGGELIAFQTIADTIVDPGDDTATGVALQAAKAGQTGSGLTGEGQLVDPYDFVDTVTLEATTTGGVDGETDDDYLNRLADELRLLAPRPILAADFATYARRVAGVSRAVAIDNFIPPSTTDAERAVFVVCVDSAGEVVTSATKTEVDTLLQSQREVNFIVNVGDPTYTTVNVTFTAVSWPDFTPADVQAAAVEAVQTFLSPSQWGQPDFGESLAWVNTTRVRMGEVFAVLSSVEGLRYVDTLTLAASGITPETNGDLILPGAAPLTRAGTITGTVT